MIVEDSRNGSGRQERSYSMFSQLVDNHITDGDELVSIRNYGQGRRANVKVMVKYAAHGRKKR
jgi:hypothetical protein